MKKSTKIVLTSLSILASTAMLAPLADSAMADSAVVSSNAASATNNVASETQTITMAITKTGTNQPSEAASFLGNSATVTLKDGKVASVTIHVDGSKSPMTKGQDLSKVVSSVSLNGQAGKVENVAQNSTSLDFVFDGSAYKEGKGTLDFTLSVMGKTMNESADVTLGAVKTTTTDSAKTTTEKDASNSKTSNNTATQTETTTTTSTAKKANKAKHSKKAKAVKRTLKHNAYAYKKNGKRANKKLYKKGKKVSTYGKAIKLHGKAYYRISKNTYIKKANF